MTWKNFFDEFDNFFLQMIEKKWQGYLILQNK